LIKRSYHDNPDLDITSTMTMISTHNKFILHIEQHIIKSIYDTLLYALLQCHLFESKSGPEATMSEIAESSVSGTDAPPAAAITTPDITPSTIP